jgi:FKBP-type peptidyl-prolyl cis-trans isomerase
LVGMALLTSPYPMTTEEQFVGIERLTAKNQRLQDELSRQQIQMQHLQAAFEEVLATKQRLESQLAEAQATMAQLLAENEQLTTDLNELKQAPFKSRRRSATTRTSTTSSGPVVTLVRDDGDRSGLIRPNGSQSVTLVPIVALLLRVKFSSAAGSSKILNRFAPLS